MSTHIQNEQLLNLSKEQENAHDVVSSLQQVVFIFVCSATGDFFSSQQGADEGA